MNWYRIKTILIFLFLAINLFLASLLFYENFAIKKAEEKRLESAIGVLRDAGIKVEAPQIPVKHPRMATLTVQNQLADKEAFCARLLGGTPVRMGNTYRRQGKSVTITDTGFMYRSGHAPAPAAKNAVKSMKTALSKLGFSMEYAKGYEKDGKVYFAMEISGKPLYGSALIVTPGGEEIAEMEGNWPQVLEVKSTKTPTLGAADALMHLLHTSDISGETVEKIALGYTVLVEGGYQTADAVPVWRLETDENVYFYDARS